MLQNSRFKTCSLPLVVTCHHRLKGPSTNELLYDKIFREGDTC